MPTSISRAFQYDFWVSNLRVAASGAVKIAGILILYLIARVVVNRIIDAALARLLARQKPLVGGEEHTNRLRTVQGLVKNVAGYALLFIFIVEVLDALSLNVTGLITTAGIGGIAIGFGAQKMVRDVVAGFFIIVEDQFAVGDWVTIGAASGEVLDIGMRITRLRDDQGRLWILGNGDISAVTNYSRAPVEGFIEIGLAASADVRHATEIIDEAGAALYRDHAGHLTAAPKAQGVAGFDAARTAIRVSIQSDPRALGLEQLRVRETIRERLVTEGIAVG